MLYFPQLVGDTIMCPSDSLFLPNTPTIHNFWQECPSLGEINDRWAHARDNGACCLQVINLPCLPSFSSSSFSWGQHRPPAIWRAVMSDRPSGRLLAEVGMAVGSDNTQSKNWLDFNNKTGLRRVLNLKVLAPVIKAEQVKLTLTLTSCWALAATLDY